MGLNNEMPITAHVKLQGCLAINEPTVFELVKGSINDGDWVYIPDGSESFVYGKEWTGMRLICKDGVLYPCKDGDVVPAYEGVVFVANM